MIIGGLAGALAFASDNAPEHERIHAWVEDGYPVVLVDGERGHEETLRSFGAGRVGRL